MNGRNDYDSSVKSERMACEQRSRERVCIPDNECDNVYSVSTRREEEEKRSPCAGHGCFSLFAHHRDKGK